LARKILLADDSVTAQSMGRRILTEAGYEVVTVNNGSAALKKIAEHLPDLLILDVYMPGYGGLEVCQRLKGAEETARIPVLLTVGKLEPFKAEEARRVRADAYLVKPFEASELLSALVKLEDKIVPRSQTPAPASFAKALAVMEEQSSTGGRKKGFGNQDSGWKERLSIPGTLKRREEPVPPAPEASPDTGFRDFSRREEPTAPVSVASAAEGRAADGYLRGITPEEIAAITAAAAAFGGEGAPEVPEASVPVVEEAASVPSEPAPVEAVSEIAAEDSAPTPSIAEAAESTQSSLVEPEPISAYTAVITGNPPADEIPAVPELPPARSFAPAEGEGIMAAIWRTSGQSEYAEPEPVHAFAEVGASVETVRPRWIAEEVPLSDGEAADLEYEMQKAQAAMAEEAASAAAASVQAEDTTPVAAAQDPSPAVTEEVAAPEPSAEVSAETTAAGQAEETQPQIVEAVAAMSAEVTNEIAADDTPAAQAIASETIAEPVQESATLAAAAAAGVGTMGGVDSSSSPALSAPAVQPESDSPAVSAENSAPAADPQEQEHEAELAHAWAQWRQIRESIASPQMAAQLADVAAAELQASQSAAGSTESHFEKDSRSDSGSPDAIASIVDSVLSELKPKIVEEIARKLGGKK